jgi:hypothetical protein
MGDMAHTLGCLRGTYMGDHNGERPTAFRIHPEDWHKLLSEVQPLSGWMGPDRKFMGMNALVDPKWQKGFPVCVGTKGAAEAIEAGAHQG